MLWVEVRFILTLLQGCLVLLTAFEFIGPTGSTIVRVITFGILPDYMGGFLSAKGFHQVRKLLSERHKFSRSSRCCHNRWRCDHIRWGLNHNSSWRLNRGYLSFFNFGRWGSLLSLLRLNLWVFERTRSSIYTLLPIDVEYYNIADLLPNDLRHFKSNNNNR